MTKIYLNSGFWKCSFMPASPSISAALYQVCTFFTALLVAMDRGAKFQSSSFGRLDRNLDFLSLCFVYAPGPYSALPYHHLKLLSKAGRLETTALSRHNLHNHQQSLLGLNQCRREHVDGFPLWKGVSKIKEKQKAADGNGLEQGRGKLLAEERQTHGVVSPYKAWERLWQKGEQQDAFPHCHGNSQRTGWAGLEMSPAWDCFQ